MFTAIQIVLIAFILFALTRVILRTKEKILSLKTAIFWTIIWLIALIGVTLPATTTKIAAYFGVGRGVDIIVYVSISVLFYLVFRIYVMIEDLRHELTGIIRKIALKSVRNKPVRKKV